MRWFFLFLTVWLLTTPLASGNEWEDQKLPLADEAKPLYQWKGWPPPGNMWLGGKCYKVRITTLDPSEQEALAMKKAEHALQLKEMERGSWLLIAGVIMVGLGTTAHFCTAYPIAQRLSEYILVLGGCLVASGILLKKIAVYQNWIFYVLAATVIGLILYKGRKWSLSHLFKGGKK